MTSNYTTLHENDDISTPKSPRSNIKIVFGLLFAVAAVSVVASSFQVTNKTTLTETEEDTLQVVNEFETRTGRVLNDGLLENLVRVHSPTTLSLKSGNAVIFHVETSPGTNEFTQLNQEVVSNIDHVFTEIGKHNVKASVTASDGTTSTLIYTVTAKVIRIELRDLTEEDRKIYFDALQKFQFTSEIDGVATYGKKFHSLEYILRMHLYGAADKECDHWHDDAGFLNHHVAITWQFEQSLRKIDPRTAAHYWDYTREPGRDQLWYKSNIFDDEWFGSNSPNNADHIVDKGRFAYSPVVHGTGFSTIVNPYGLLRSPWNTNPTPYLMRSNTTFFDFADESSNFPTCSDFAGYAKSSLSEVLSALNGALHGRVHIMIGGHWDNSNEWKNLALESLQSAGGSPDMFLLLSKYLWRQGFTRIPETCSADTSHADCMPSCPETIVGDWDDMDDVKASQILSVAGVFDLTDVSNMHDLLNDYKLGYKDLLKELCHIGSPGEMYSSSAPQDPTFWPLHGNAERFITFLRVSKAKGLIEFDETWGYEHISELASDNGIVCDWSEVEAGSLEMPTCSKGTCSGHKEDDLLPFTDLYHEQGSTLLTNSEFYQVIHPYSDKLPYAFDTFSYWEACDKHNLFDQYASSSKVKAVSKNTEGLGGM
mmetsp:Transcript_24930/g.29454  ORF Transcript_24930/g.29454 Transcript_24930/m.29454 type:complete len:652 (+) Transcript_24930:87-2042(+)